MPHTPETVDQDAWHKFFAIEANNRAWDLAVTERDEKLNAEMLNAAHAAANHWSVVGTELHNYRAKMLLAEVHSLLGLSATSVSLAEEVKRFFETADAPDWEAALVLAIHAHAHCVAGNQETYRSSYSDAHAAIAQIKDEQDREIVMQTFEQIPAP